MRKSDNNQKATSAHRKVQSSTTLNRRYVRRPSKTANASGASLKKEDNSVTIKRSPEIRRFGGAYDNRSAKVNTVTVSEAQEKIQAPQAHPMQVSAHKKMRGRSSEKSAPVEKKMSAKELKDQAIQKALASAAQPAKEEKTSKKAAKSKRVRKEKTKSLGGMHFGFGRVVLALSCAAAAVFAIVYFVNLNMPDISLRVAAMQTGIEASYPNYIPRDYSLSDITSEDGKITLNFRNAETGDAFSLVEETSPWDSSALLTNYVKDAYGENYTVIREQGLTIYVSGSDACWVNGGVVYKLKTTTGSLTKKQIKSIATSL